MTQYSLWPASSGPANSFDETGPVTLAVEFAVTDTAWFVGWRMYRGVIGIPAPDMYRLWRVDSASAGTLLASQAPDAFAGTGWQVTMLETPVSLVVDQPYRVSFEVPGGVGNPAYSATAAYWSTGDGSSGITNGILVAPSAADAVGNDQGSFIAGATPVFPTNSFNAGNYWIDPVVADSSQAAALGITTETDTALPLGRRHVRALEVATGTEVALPLGRAKARTLGAAAEADTALIVAASGGLAVAWPPRAGAVTIVPVATATTVSIT